MGAAATLLAASEIQMNNFWASSPSRAFSLSRHGAASRPSHGLPTFPFATLLIKFTAWRLNFAADDYDLVRALGKISRPVLFIGGTKDVRMPTATVLEPLHAAAANPLRRKFIVEGATHGRAYDESPDGTSKL